MRKSEEKKEKYIIDENYEYRVSSFRSTKTSQQFLSRFIHNPIIEGSDLIVISLVGVEFYNCVSTLMTAV